MAEDSLLTRPPESTNEPSAIAKIAGIKLCESYNRQYCFDVTIRDLAETVVRETGFQGISSFGTGTPGGPRKLMDFVRLVRLGWVAGIGSVGGISGTYAWFLDQEVHSLRSK